MKASWVHFCSVVDRIKQNSWWAANFPTDQPGLGGFAISFATSEPTITEVPKEPLESLLLQVRKLTMNDSPENLHKIRTELRFAASFSDQESLDLWHGYWKLRFLHPVFKWSKGKDQHTMTPWRVYECLINGELFHSNDPEYNAIIHGTPTPSELQPPHMFLRNFFHLAVTNLCNAAIGLKRFIDNGCTFEGLPTDAGIVDGTLSFLQYRGKVNLLKDRIRESRAELHSQGGNQRCEWA